MSWGHQVGWRPLLPLDFGSQDDVDDEPKHTLRSKVRPKSLYATTQSWSQRTTENVGANVWAHWHACHEKWYTKSTKHLNHQHPHSLHNDPTPQEISPPNPPPRPWLNLLFASTAAFASRSRWTTESLFRSAAKCSGVQPREPPPEASRRQNPTERRGEKFSENFWCLKSFENCGRSISSMDLTNTVVLRCLEVIELAEIAMSTTVAVQMIWYHHSLFNLHGPASFSENHYISTCCIQTSIRITTKLEPNYSRPLHAIASCHCISKSPRWSSNNIFEARAPFIRLLHGVHVAANKMSYGSYFVFLGCFQDVTTSDPIQVKDILLRKWWTDMFGELKGTNSRIGRNMQKIGKYSKMTRRNLSVRGGLKSRLPNTPCIEMQVQDCCRSAATLQLPTGYCNYKLATCYHYWVSYCNWLLATGYCNWKLATATANASYWLLQLQTGYCNGKQATCYSLLLL